MLAAVLAVSLLVVAKALIERAAFRNTLGTVCLVLLGPLLWYVIEALVSAAFDTGLGQIEIHLPKWIYQLTIGVLFLGSFLLLADQVLDIEWPW